MKSVFLTTKDTSKILNEIVKKNKLSIQTVEKIFQKKLPILDNLPKKEKEKAFEELRSKIEYLVIPAHDPKNKELLKNLLDEISYTSRAIYFLNHKIKMFKKEKQYRSLGISIPKLIQELKEERSKFFLNLLELEKKLEALNPRDSLKFLLNSKKYFFIFSIGVLAFDVASILWLYLDPKSAISSSTANNPISLILIGSLVILINAFPFFIYKLAKREDEVLDLFKDKIEKAVSEFSQKFKK